MSKLTKVLLGIILALALVALVIFVIAGNQADDDDQMPSEDVAVIESFKVEDGSFVIEGSGFETAEVYGMISNIATPRLLGEATSNGANVWSLPVPEAPLLLEEIYAVGLDIDGREVVRKEFGASGVPDIYGTLYLDVSVENIELSVGDSIEMDGATITLVDIVSDELCSETECRDGRDATVTVSVQQEGEEEVTGNVSTRVVGESIGNYYVNLADIEPEPNTPGAEYVVTLAISKNIKG